jgi:AcrR family transcriptional regulator
MSESNDPLFETLFRGSSSALALASAAPVPTIGTHSRAGNAMGRTRLALLAGASQAVANTGTKITMSQVAALSGVAKATLYNHFRTREAVLAALLAHQVDELIERVGSAPLERALIETASEISTHPVLRLLAQTDPGTLAALARVDTRLEGWRRANDAVAAALSRAGLGGTNIILRWLASYVVTPGRPDSIVEDARILLTGLPAAPAAVAGDTGSVGVTDPGPLGVLGAASMGVPDAGRMGVSDAEARSA